MQLVCKACNVNCTTFQKIIHSARATNLPLVETKMSKQVRKKFNSPRTAEMKFSKLLLKYRDFVAYFRRGLGKILFLTYAKGFFSEFDFGTRPCLVLETSHSLKNPFSMR